MNRVGVVDIGTNSMRLLITGRDGEVGRWVEVTGLGRGVDATGRLSELGMSASIEAFERFAELLDDREVDSLKVIATSACRDSSNREEFFDRVEQTLGARPALITGQQEAQYAFSGAADKASGALVSDIGGGSAEFVTAHESVSFQIGSVRLTDRLLGERPPSAHAIDAARSMVNGVFADVDFEYTEIVGVAGTWTSLSAVIQRLKRYERERVHGSTIEVGELASTIDWMSGMSLRELEEIPSLDPKRAPVILGGAIVAEGVLKALGSERAKISERDTLDGVADELLA